MQRLLLIIILALFFDRLIGPVGTGKVRTDKIMKLPALKGLLFVAVFLRLVVILPVCYAQEAVIARGDGILVTEADVQGMRKATKEWFRPTRKALEEATVRIVLFAREAEAEKISCPEAREMDGFARRLQLADCYINEKLNRVDLLPGAIESYYLVNWRDFVDPKTGEMLKLDDQLRAVIRKHILTAKRKIFTRQEYKRLCQKYQVTFVAGNS